MGGAGGNLMSSSSNNYKTVPCKYFQQGEKKFTKTFFKWFFTVFL